MRISIEEKHSLVARYQAGESVSDICADSGVPKSTFYTWIKPYTVTMTDSGHAVSQQAFIKMKQKLQSWRRRSRFYKRSTARFQRRFKKSCKSLPNCMVSIVSMPYARRFVYPAVPSTTISSGEKR